MNRRTLAGLLVLNGVLLAALLGLVLPEGARAQFGGAAGNYVMVASEGDSGSDTVYMVDLNRGILIGIEPERRGRDNRLNIVNYRIIANDVKQNRRDR